MNTASIGYLSNLNWWECAGSAAVKVGRMETEEIEALSLNISLSPNPAKDFINLTIDAEAAIVKIFDIDGKLFYLPCYIYIFKVISANITDIRKMIKE